MTLSDEQKKAVAAWVAAGDNISAVQRKLFEQYKLSLTYMDVRFLVDDLDLKLKDAAPKAQADLGKPAAAPPERATGEKKGLLEKAKEKLGFSGGPPEADEPGEEDLADEAEDFGPGGGGPVSVSVDAVTLIPGALASGTVTFSDGVTGKWIVDNYGRPGFTEISRPGYRPSAADSQAFVQELSGALQKKGF